MGAISSLCMRPRALGFRVGDNNPVGHRTLALTMACPGVWRVGLVGGGGGGGDQYAQGVWIADGQGGGGGSRTLQNIYSRNATVTFTIGAGGIRGVQGVRNGQAGGSTTALGLTVAGGVGGSNGYAGANYVRFGGSPTYAQIPRGSSLLRDWQRFTAWNYDQYAEFIPLATVNSTLGGGGNGKEALGAGAVQDGFEGGISGLALIG